MFQNPCAFLFGEQLFIAWASGSMLLAPDWGFLLLFLSVAYMFIFPTSW